MLLALTCGKGGFLIYIVPIDMMALYLDNSLCRLLLLHEFILVLRLAVLVDVENVIIFLVASIQGEVHNTP